MKAFVFVSLMTIGSLASADLTGKWHGTGNLTNGSTRSACNDVRFDVTQSATKFTLNSGSFTCGNIAGAWSASSADVVNGELVENGKKIGTINANSISATVLSNDGKFKAIYHANLTQAGAYYTQTMIDTTSSQIVMSMDAQLVR